jgi:phospholipid/cholesterol/gamma-HCH transport system substrate-binding protein
VTDRFATGRVRTAMIAVLLSALSAGALTACSGPHRIQVTARFADVGSLTTRAPVMMDDVTIGEVTRIGLAGHEALVTMAIDPTAQVPTDVTARIRRTSLLGEQVVDLVVSAGLPADAPLLADGATIANTEMRADLEDLVSSANAVLAPLAASEVATLVDEGATGFGGRGDDLRGLLDGLGQIVHAYAGRTDEIRSVIDSLNRLNGTLAANASAQGLAVKNGAQALNVLSEESGRLQAAIHALARLAVGARGILDAHSDEMNRFFEQTRVILGVLSSEQSDIERLLRYAPLHDRNTQLVEYQQMNQVLQDFVICGLNNDQSDPARRCQGS